MDLEIREVKSVEDAKICDKFCEKLSKSEKGFDKHIYSGQSKNWNEKLLGLWNWFLALAYFNDQPIGFVCAKYIQAPKHTYDAHSITIVSLYVEEKFRNKGVAKNLIQAVEDWSQKLCKGKEYLLSVTAISTNLNAINVYKHLGFEEYAITFRKEHKKAD